MTSDSKSEDLTDILNRLKEDTDGDRVSFRDLLGVFGQRAFGPLLLIPAVIAVAPTGAIPGMSIVTGSIIVLVAAQLVFGVGNPWLPKRLLEISFPRERLVSAIESIAPYTERVDGFIRPRLHFATTKTAIKLASLFAVLLGVSMFPLALLPFAVAVPGTAVALLGLGITANDGLLIVAAAVFVLVVAIAGTALGVAIPLSGNRNAF